MNLILEQISNLEKEGISVTLGSGVPYLKFNRKYKYGIQLHWSNLDKMWEGGPRGAFGDEIEFNNYEEFPKIFEELVHKFKKKISDFLGGDSI